MVYSRTWVCKHFRFPILLPSAVQPFPLFIPMCHTPFPFSFFYYLLSAHLISLSSLDLRPAFLSSFLLYIKLLTFHSLTRGLLDRSTGRYFYKRLKTSLHRPRGNLLENLFSKKCALKNNLKLLAKKFCLKQVQHLKMAFYFTKWPIFKIIQYFSN